MLNIGYRQLSWPGEHSILTIHNLTEDKLTAFSLLVDSCSGEFYTQRFTILMKLSHCLHINWKQITLLQLLQKQSSSATVRKNRRDKLKHEFMRSILPRWSITPTIKYESTRNICWAAFLYVSVYLMEGWDYKLIGNTKGGPSFC